MPDANRGDNRVMSSGVKVFGNKCNVNKSSGGGIEMEMWREKSQRDRGEGERKSEGASGGTAEVDTNEEPL